ncbi:MAG: hypothetical protein K2G25_09615, partial [Oscillospiraceae bacterium]|nr:hypothetical protein [Oscillospiraceae bacterium]
PIPQHKSLRVLESIPENRTIQAIPENLQNPDPVLEILQRTQKIQTIRDHQKAQRIREQEEEKREEIRRIQNQKIRPPRKNPASLQEILREQGIPCETSAADPNSVDELIARITGNE